MFIEKVIFLLVASFLWHDNLLVAQDASVLRTFGIMGANNQNDKFEEKLIQLLRNESRNIERINESTRARIYKDYLLSRVRGAVFKDFYNRHL